ncbi:inositol monophosphatase family protein [Ammoniphilus resinae]|uniref:inositol-phosphate phosphatase n=1 Tax=Ammoniphilus resinae TaxID=861532 RepID=A0ABS4GUJ6_9BACL|nr:inositol monophosphatase [Ammoniphilus resinae]MBP1933946.1 myo-inositol-1(or 4)-monophosphatase [Ammoniphilus resinae]
MLDIQELSKKAVDWAKEAGKKSIELRKKQIKIKYKSSPSDLVTEVDQEIEKFLIGQILSSYSDHGIVGEEGFFKGDPKEYDTLWIIDPIDGTTNFVHQQVNYVISIAVVHKGEGLIGVVYDPTRDELFFAKKGEGATLNDRPIHLQTPVPLREGLICTSLFWNQRTEKLGLDHLVDELPRSCRGIRIYGCAALEMAYVAAGRVDAYISLSLNPWDFAASKIILEEAGGITSTIDGSTLTFEKANSVVASNPFLYKELMEFVARN